MVKHPKGRLRYPSGKTDFHTSEVCVCGGYAAQMHTWIIFFFLKGIVLSSDRCNDCKKKLCLYILCVHVQLKVNCPYRNNEPLRPGTHWHTFTVPRHSYAQTYCIQYVYSQIQTHPAPHAVQRAATPTHDSTHAGADAAPLSSSLSAVLQSLQ